MSVDLSDEELTYRMYPELGLKQLLQSEDDLPKIVPIVKPKLSDPDFQRATGVYVALQWYNEPLIAERTSLDLVFVCYWLALEALADAHARKILDDIANALQEKGLTGNQWAWALDTLRADLLMPGHDKDKVRALIKDLELPSYKRDIDAIQDRRSKLVHTGLAVHKEETGGSGLASDMRRLRRLIEKVLCILLGIYGSPLIDGSIIADDLLAREAPPDYTERLRQIQETRTIYKIRHQDTPPKA